MKKIIMILLAGFAFVAPCFAKDGDLKFAGTLESISAQSATISGQVFALTLATEFENSADQQVGFDALTVGQSVEVKYRVVDGQNIARELEIQGVDNGSDDGVSNPGDDHGNHQAIEHRNLKTKIADSATGSLLRVERKSQKRNRSRIKVSLKLPLAQNGIAVDPVVLAALQVQAVFSRGGVPYAQCSVGFDGIRLHEGLASAQYRLDVRSQGRFGERARALSGACDIDLATDGIQAGVPNVLAGDSVTVTETTSGLSVSGTIR